MNEENSEWVIGPISPHYEVRFTATFIATLPDGTRVVLPAGTVMREDKIVLREPSPEARKVFEEQAVALGGTPNDSR